MALKEEKVHVTSGKKKASVRKETSAVSGMRVTIVPKNQNTLPPHPPSHQCHEVEVCRRKEISKANKINYGAILRQPCRYDLKGTCTRSPCEYWHLPECQIYKTETGCKAKDKCLFQHQKVDEQPNKMSKRATILKKEESDDNNVVAIVKIVPQLGCVSQDSDALVSQRGKQFRENPMQKVLGSIRKVPFTESTQRQASIREKKRPSLGKIQLNVP